MLLNGYWPMKAPMGYNQITRKKRDNLNLEQRQKITINETGLLIKKAFYWKAEDKLSNVEILARLKKLGLTINKKTFGKILRNPFYCGIMTHNLLNGQVIEGRHEKLIPKEIFLLANSIKSRNMTYKPTKDFSEIPLKNFLKCGLCGSSFVGYEVKKKKLWYYKCMKDGCKCNRSAKTLNQLFYEKLGKFTIDEKYIEPIKDEFLKYFNESVKESTTTLTILKARKTETEKKIEALEERFAIGEINNELFQKFVSKYKKERSEIITDIDRFSFGTSNLEKKLEKYIQILTKPAQLWASNGYRGKLELQELLFPKGILYDREKNKYRTIETNPVMFTIAEISRSLGGNKKRDNGFNHQLSPSVLRRSTIN